MAQPAHREPEPPVGDGKILHDVDDELQDEPARQEQGDARRADYDTETVEKVYRWA